MIYGSVCSGIEAASVAWHPLGWRAAFLSEIEPFPRAVLAHHYPTVPLHGDFTTIQVDEYEPVDLLVGGTPCQSFSVAGLRGGLADERGNLALQFLALAGRLRPRWIVWENVPGVLSSGGGRDFGSFLGGLVELGYGFAYRVLDAQFYGLAQRRKRVFVVGHLGDWRRAWAVLSQPASLRWDTPPRREAAEGATGTLEASLGRSRGAGTPTAAIQPVANPLGAKRDGGWRGDLDNDTYVAHSLRADGFDASEDGTGRGTPLVSVLAFDARQSDVIQYGDQSGPGQGYPATMQGAAVRRLTPTECARLQGFPDTYLDIQFRGRPAADGNKYRALGNSFAVPVIRWLGERIAAQEEEMRATHANVAAAA